MCVFRVFIFCWWLYRVFDRGAKIRFIYAEKVEPLVPVDLVIFGMIVVLLLVGLKFIKKTIFVFSCFKMFW